jgi:DNA-binding transcriptional MerR regulator
VTTTINDDPLILARTYSTVEAAALVGISFREVDYWTREGAIRPAVEAAGSGSRRVWTAEQVQWLQRIANVRLAATQAGFVLTMEGVNDIWTACESGRQWRLTLRA